MTKEQLEELYNAGAFSDFADEHFSGMTGDEIYDAVYSGSVDLDDLPDFAWADYLE